MTYKVIVDNISREEWEGYAANFADYSIYQTWSYQQVRAEMDGHEVSRAIIKDERGHVVTMSQVRIKHVKPLGLRIGYVQWGPLVRATDGTLKCTAEALKVLWQSYVGPKINLFRIVPNIYNDEIGRQFSQMLVSSGFRHVPSVRPYNTMMFPLNVSEQDMLSRLHRKWRGSLKKAGKGNIEIREGVNQEYFDILDELYSAVQRRKGFKGLDVGVFAKTQRLLSPKQKMNFVLVYHGDQVVTVDLTSYLGDTAMGIFQASSPEGLQCGGSYLAWWHALLAAKRGGMRRYDLGGIDPKNNPTVYRFKARMGGEDTFYIGAFEATTNTTIKNMWHISEKIYRLIKK